MNVRRFSARTSRDALTLVREALGEDAVVLSTRLGIDGVEILAMAPEGLLQVERQATPAGASAAAATAPAAGATAPPAPGQAAKAATAKALTARAATTTALTTKAAAQAAAVKSAAAEPTGTSAVAADVATLSMSTLSFQDYVRERLLRRRRAALGSEARPVAAAAAVAAPTAAVAAPLDSHAAARLDGRAGAPAASGAWAGIPATPDAWAGTPATPDSWTGTPPAADAWAGTPAATEFRDGPPHAGLASERSGVLEQRMAAHSAASAAAAASPIPQPAAHAREPLPLDPLPRAGDSRMSQADGASARHDQQDMMNELRQVKGLIEERFGALAFIEKLQRQPGQARLSQKLLDCGFSPALIRKLGDSLPGDIADESAWAAAVLERNLSVADDAIEEQGGVYALVGATGVGKTTTTAKIAAAFATRYGAAHLGLITLDAYRVGAHEQLRAYGRILGVPVHTAHDRASLEDLLELLGAKKMVLVDTAGMAQRDARTRELLDMLSHRAIQKLLVVNAASQGETIEDVLIAYRAASCSGVVLSKLDEAVKLAPALDALIRHKLRLVGVANGQRVPEDWHRLSANALVQRALRGGGGSAYRLDARDVSLIFTAPLGAQQPAAALHA